MIETVQHGGKVYPALQTTGNAARFVLPFATEVCKGRGLDVGAGRLQWSLPGSRPVDIAFPNEWEADNLPPGQYDYVFSSHCLEHVPNWVSTLDYWASKLIDGGVLFLYLPDFSQTYWRPWSNPRHLHVFTPDIIRGYMEDRGHTGVFVSGVDLNSSFVAICHV